MHLNVASVVQRAALALAVGVAVLAAACGGGGEGEDATASVTLDQLPDMVLQLEDLPAGYVPSEAGELRGSAGMGTLGGYTAYYFRLDESGQFQGDAACVWASVTLYESSGKAKAILQEAKRSSEGQPESVSIPTIGDNSVARSYFPRGVPHSCGGEDAAEVLSDVDAEVTAVLFHRGRIEGSI
ncbi:MAG: hypothetical protein AMJ76_02050, partial [Dehalococcoidia bacterium SM23_28_1]